MPDAFTELDLLNLDPKTELPPQPSRLKNVKSAHSVYQTLRKADEKSATNRARIQAIFDGVAPYDQALLRSTGQASRTNLNWGEANRYLDVAVAGYVDLINSVDTMVQVVSTVGELEDKMYSETVIAEEATRTIRSWPEFHLNYLRLINEFVIHGVGITMFPGDDFRFRVTGLGNFFVPRQTPASEHSCEVACFRDDLMLHELYDPIRDEAKAEEMGWNVKAVKGVMMKCASTDRPNTPFTDWEVLQNEVKNNDVYYGIRSNTVPIVHTFAREFDGTVSHYIHCETDATDFLFKYPSRFQNPESAYLFFANGVGTNGTLHSIRGLGQKLFAHIQTSNRLRSQAVDAAMLASTIMIQPESQRSLDELSLQYYGPYTVLSPNVKITEKAVPNLSNSVMPIISELAQTAERNLDFYSTIGAASGSQYRSSAQVSAELEAATRLNGSTLNLFYNSWRRLLREMIRRIANGDRTDPAIREFFKRCAERGVDRATILKLDFDRTSAVKALGAGNASARVAALADLDSVMPMLDESGRKNLIFDRVAARVGYESARRYAEPVAEQAPNTDVKLAKLENSLMALGQPVEINPNDLHGSHFSTHAPEIQQILAGLESGQIDGAAIMPILEQLHTHTAQHVQLLSGDPNAQPLAAAARELIANSEAVLMNLMRAQQKAERDQAEAAGETGGNPATDYKAREMELRLQEIAQRIELERTKFETTYKLKEQKFTQDMALADIRTRNQLSMQQPVL